jgi:hypothetical protein
LRATSALDCITNVPIGTCVDTQCGRQSERKRVRADAASTCAERPGTGKRFAHILHACKGIPPGSRQIGWRALSQAQPRSVLPFDYGATRQKKSRKKNGGHENTIPTPPARSRSSGIPMPGAGVVSRLWTWTEDGRPPFSRASGSTLAPGPAPSFVASAML